MRRISSRMTFFYKRLFPVFWFGFLALFVTLPFIFGRHQSAPPPPFFIIPAILAVFGFFIMKKLVFDLVDEVWEDGDTLLVRNRGQEERIALSDIKNVNYSIYVNPPRVALLLRRHTVFGDEISFGAPIRFIPFATSPIINDLIERVDAARQHRA
jgi:hypothetical protein